MVRGHGSARLRRRRTRPFRLPGTCGRSCPYRLRSLDPKRMRVVCSTISFRAIVIWVIAIRWAKTFATLFVTVTGGRWPACCSARPACACRLSASVLAQAGTQTGGLEVRGPRRHHRLGPPHARTQPAAPDEQHALSDPAVGRGPASLPAPPACRVRDADRRALARQAGGQSSAGAHHPACPRRLAGEVRSSRACVGDFRGPLAVQGNLLPRGQLVAAGRDAGSHAQRSRPPHPGTRQRRVSVSAGQGLQRGVVR